MQIKSVELIETDGSRGVLALAIVELEDFPISQINGIAIRDGQNGIWAAFPSTKIEDDWMDIVNFSDKKMKYQIGDAVVATYCEEKGLPIPQKPAFGKGKGYKGKSTATPAANKVYKASSTTVRNTANQLMGKPAQPDLGEISLDDNDLPF